MYEILVRVNEANWFFCLSLVLMGQTEMLHMKIVCGVDRGCGLTHKSVQRAGSTVRT